MSKDIIWGPIITSEDIDEEDPVRKLMTRIKEIKESKIDFSDGKTLKEVQEEKAAKITELEREITTIFYERKTRRLLS